MHLKSVFTLWILSSVFYDLTCLATWITYITERCGVKFQDDLQNVYIKSIALITYNSFIVYYGCQNLAPKGTRQDGQRLFDPAWAMLRPFIDRPLNARL